MTYDGIQMPSMETNMVARSIHVFRYSAAPIPMGMPTRRARSIGEKARTNVRGKALVIISWMVVSG